ncbi:MAG TPA: transcription antitermination factor NusB [Candidatus Babeliales bacterium]|nr:transcription antitermination factor NusB [Candidatus Babeliales bacterium]
MSCSVDTTDDIVGTHVYAELSRRDIRSLIFHYLYAMDSLSYEDSLESIVDMLNRGFDLDVPLDSEVVVITQAIIDQRDQLDQQMVPFLHNWRLERVGLATKLILRLAFWELDQKDVVHNIIINEAIELAKCFAEKDAYKFINGVLDEAVKSRGIILTDDTVAE